jgi:hypothetical protein
MRTLLLTVAAMLLVVDAAGAGPAQRHKRGKPHAPHAQRHDRQVAAPRGAGPVDPGNGAWRPRDANKLPFGSTHWWDEMLREGRINGDTM